MGCGSTGIKNLSAKLFDIVRVGRMIFRVKTNILDHTSFRVGCAILILMKGTTIP